MKIGRVIGGIVALCLMTQLTGCQLGNTKIVWQEEKRASRKYLFAVNDMTCDVKLAKLYLCNYRNLYGNAYGIDLWQYDFEGESLEQYVKDVTLEELTRIVCMNLLAKEREISLTDEEMSLAADAAKEYYNSLNEAELAYMELRESDVDMAYRQYALAKKLYDILTEGIDEEVSDDEARVISVQQIYVTSQEAVEKVQEKLEAGDSFAAVASAFSEADEIELKVARDDLPQNVENIAFNLDKGEVSECIETDAGYYFINCLSKLEEELTEANKDNIRMKRRVAQFDEVYLEFVAGVLFDMNDEQWAEVTIEGVEGIETDSFFEVYTKYFH